MPDRSTRTPPPWNEGWLPVLLFVAIISAFAGLVILIEALT